eukprot:UN02864
MSADKTSKSFKDEKTFEQRQQEAARIIEKYPDRIPVIAERRKDSDLPEIDKKKYLVPKDLTVGQFVYVIRKRIKLSPEKALYIFVNKQLLSTSSHMTDVYRQYSSNDGFLYVVYAAEKSFGGEMVELDLSEVDFE